MASDKSKKKADALRRRLFRKPRLVWDFLGPREKKSVFAFAEEYKTFLNDAKTEREAVRAIEGFAKQQGFVDMTGQGAGTRLYSVSKRKNIALAVLGRKPVSEGINLIVSHIDAPRLDIKQNPLYEETDLAFLKTHYYGGIKKYQWLARPLAIHGTIFKSNGDSFHMSIGEKPEEPVFTIADLLPHLSRKTQSEKKVSDAFEGEKLNVLVGSLPFGDDEVAERFKLGVLEHLHANYGFIEEDLMSAELEVVPAGEARDIGWDRGLVGGYGQDDRSCAFTSAKAIGEVEAPTRTAVALFLDKEEVGSDGSTGAKSRFLEDFVSQLLCKSGLDATGRNLRDCLMKTKALSADVAGALDPDYQEVHEKRNAARIGYGVCITKFTGSGGKYGSSDANAEYLSEIRSLFNRHKIVWQTGELGKVDEGGGGTVAKFLAVYGMEVLDCGMPLLSTHAPFEIASKADLYMTYKACGAFFTGA